MPSTGALLIAYASPRVVRCCPRTEAFRRRKLSARGTWSSGREPVSDGICPGGQARMIFWRTAGEVPPFRRVQIQVDGEDGLGLQVVRRSGGEAQYEPSIVEHVGRDATGGASHASTGHPVGRAGQRLARRRRVVTVARGFSIQGDGEPIGVLAVPESADGHMPERRVDGLSGEGRRGSGMENPLANVLTGLLGFPETEGNRRRERVQEPARNGVAGTPPARPAARARGSPSLRGRETVAVPRSRGRTCSRGET